MPENIQLFHESLNRCLADKDFLNRFYDHFINSSDDIKHIFEKHSEMQSLKRKLTNTLDILDMQVDGEAGSDYYMEYLGRVHGHFGISKEMYQDWIKALIWSVKQSDPQFDKTLEKIWCKVIQGAVDAMQV